MLTVLDAKVFIKNKTIKNHLHLEKFYTFLNQKGLMDREDLQEFKAMIKEAMPEWIATLERYDDPSIEDMSAVWGF